MSFEQKTKLVTLNNSKAILLVLASRCGVSNIDLTTHNKLPQTHIICLTNGILNIILKNS